MNEDEFNGSASSHFDDGYVKFSETLNILVIGKVSSGKSSLINAIFQRDRSNPIAAVGAESGVTTQVKIFRLDENTTIIDSPGIYDIESSNSDETKKIMASIDAGILVVTGSSDETQKRIMDELSATCSKVFVVVNKFDEHDRIKQSARDAVLEQWRNQLGVERVFPTCTFGFDPEADEASEMDVRGVDELRDAVYEFLCEKGKEVLLARNMRDKSAYAVRIVAGAVVLVAGQALLPGSAAWITATQALAICSLYYLYTGRVMSKQSALAALPSFAAQAVGSNLFLWSKSFLPPTGILDAAAVGVAVVVTAATLITVNVMFADGHELRESDRIRSTYMSVKTKVSYSISEAKATDLASVDFLRGLIKQVMYHR